MSEQAIPTPHDRVFKQALSDIRIAKDFFNHYLPEKIKNIINLEVLEIQDRTFVDEELQARAVDMLYRTQFRADQVQQEGYLYLLVEQQTVADRWLPLRLMRYMGDILDLHRKQNPYVKHLPLIVPIIFYTGENAYSYSTNLFDLFKPYQELAKQLFIEPYHLINLQNIPDEEIRKHPKSGLMEMLMKHIKHRDGLILMREAFETFLPFLLIDNSHDNYVSGMLKYTLDQGEVGDVELFLLEIRRCLPEPIEEKIMTIAEQLIQKGMQQGMQQGMQRGMQQGELALLTRQLKFRFGEIPSIFLEKLCKANESTLLLWGEMLLEANSLKEIFDELLVD